MKVEFIDTQWMLDDERVVMDLEIIPRIGETVHFCTSVLEGNYLEMFNDGIDDDGDELDASDFVVANEYAGNKTKTVAATVNTVSHIYKETGNIVEIDITFLECNDDDKENHNDDN